MGNNYTPFLCNSPRCLIKSSQSDKALLGKNDNNHTTAFIPTVKTPGQGRLVLRLLPALKQAPSRAFPLVLRTPQVMRVTGSTKCVWRLSSEGRKTRRGHQTRPGKPDQERRLTLVEDNPPSKSCLCSGSPFPGQSHQRDTNYSFALAWLTGETLPSPWKWRGRFSQIGTERS